MLLLPAAGSDQNGSSLLNRNCLTCRTDELSTDCQNPNTPQIHDTVITFLDRSMQQARDKLRNVIISGGPAAVHPDIDAILEALFPTITVTRFAGNDRFETG